MPRLRINGNDLNYEICGSGEPLVLIPGLGHSMEFWFSQIPQLEKHFQLILYDPRGVGASEKTIIPYSIQDEASDVAKLLDSLSIERAHILGVSRGGYIAIELGIGYPERVGKLVLAVTHQGGPEYLKETANIWAEMLNVAGLTPEQIFTKGVQMVTTPEFFASNKKLVEKIVHMRMAAPQPFHSFQLQFDSAGKFDARNRLSTISAPCLVIAGEKDRLVPPHMVRELAKNIPNSRFKEIPHAAHYVFIEQPEIFNREVADFLMER